MAFMKKLFLSISLIFCIIFSGCNYGEIKHWEFNYGYEKITQIKIIEITQGSNYREIEEISISFAEELYNDITNLEMKNYGPNLGSPSGLCFLIVFESGEYDIISRKEPRHFKYRDGYIQAHNSWLQCDENELYDLIAKYLSYENMSNI